LLKKLWEIQGDVRGYIEVMIKYYYAEMNAKQKIISKLNKEIDKR